jgi:hypothetical protein
MSPEQLDGDTLDCRADLYSLAAVLYHLIAGRPPFDATQQQALMHQIYNASPPPLSKLREGVPEALQALIERSLAKERELRPANWDEFAQALTALVKQRDSTRGSLQEVLDSERFTLLRSLDFFAGFGDVELWEVVHRATWQRHTYGQALYRKGEGQQLHIVTQGGQIYRDGKVWPAGRGHVGGRDNTSHRAPPAHGRHPGFAAGDHGGLHTREHGAAVAVHAPPVRQGLHRGAGEAAARSPRSHRPPATNPVAASVIANWPPCVHG